MKEGLEAGDDEAHSANNPLNRIRLLSSIFEDSWCEGIKISQFLQKGTWFEYSDR